MTVDDGNSEDGHDYLQSIFQTAHYNDLIRVHKSIQNAEGRTPVHMGSRLKCATLLDELKNHASQPASQLHDLLASPGLQGLLRVYDSLSRKDYVPKLPALLPDYPTTEPVVKIVRIVKDTPELGATLKRDETTGAILVSRIMHGSPADRSGLLAPSDEVKQINGVSVTGRSLEDVARILGKLQNGCLAFKVVQGQDEALHSGDHNRHVKTNFEYDPSCDRSCPCPEAGLAFKRGDILKLITHDDNMWWQASNISDPQMRTGLIPSKEFQDRRVSQSGTSEDSLSSSPSLRKDQNSPASSTSRSLSFRRKKKAKKIMFSSVKSLDDEGDVFRSYEEVILEYPDPALPRPIILVGAPGVGCDELRLRMIGSKSGQFASPIPHTTRHPKPYEVNGRDLQFISRAEMERGIKALHFIEHMEYKGQLYGTTFDAVEQVQSCGKSCIIHLQPHSVKRLRGSKLKPYVILVKPPPLERLVYTRREAALPQRLSGMKEFKEEELSTMIKVSDAIERHFAQFVDRILVNDELHATFKELLGLVESVRTKPQWVSALWG